MNKQKFNIKAAVPSEDIEVTDKDMDLINEHTRKELAVEDVYVYPIHMCDNEGDRDQEYFKKQDLEKLAKLFVGRTFIQDHNWSSNTNTLRYSRQK